MNLPRPSLEALNMTLVYIIAQMSKDPNTKLGAVIIGPDEELRSSGYNSFPRGLNDDMAVRMEKPEKYFWYEHAEQNAIFNAVRIGVSLKGCVMYCQGIPCADCARAVVQSGIKKVVVHKQWNDGNNAKWQESCARSKQMFKECGVQLVEWEGEILPTTGFRHGEIMELEKCNAPEQ